MVDFSFSLNNEKSDQPSDENQLKYLPESDLLQNLQH